MFPSSVGPSTAHSPSSEPAAWGCGCPGAWEMLPDPQARDRISLSESQVTAVVLVPCGAALPCHLVVTQPRPVHTAAQKSPQGTSSVEPWAAPTVGRQKAGQSGCGRVHVGICALKGRSCKSGAGRPARWSVSH